MVVFAVEVKVILIGQIRNIDRISAGFKSITGIRIQRLLDLSLDQLLRRRKDSLHLIKYNTVIGQRSIDGIQMVVPALLLKDLLFIVNIWIKYGIHIYMHQILKILIIAACYRINGLIRVSHGIQKRVQRSLRQFNKRIFYRKLFRSAEYRMFYNMRYTCRIFRRSAESDGKYLIVVRRLDRCDFGFGFVMFQKISCRV